MKINVGFYEVEISATNRLLEGDQTLPFLNELSEVYREAGRYNEENNYPAVAHLNYKAASTIFKVCMENGLYEGLE